MKNLEQGEVIFEHEDAGQDEANIELSASAYVIINSPTAECFRIFTEFEKHHEYLPRVTESDVLEREGNRAILHRVTDLGIMKVEYTYVMTIDESNFSIHYVTYPEGRNTIKYIEGFYLFEKIDKNRTLFTFSITKLDVGFKVPERIKKYMTSRDLPDVAENVKKRIESGGSWKK